jgi:hypothetical protein
MVAGGPCTPWITAADIAGRPDLPDGDKVRDSGILNAAATFGSQVLFVASGRRFAGLCGPTTVRPYFRNPMYGWRHHGQVVDSMTAALNGYAGCDSLRIGLYPIRDIVAIKIDGVTLDPSRYRLDDNRWIERRDGLPWPAFQRTDLDDTKVGTFSVTVHHGADPPAAGVDAASALGAELAKSRAGLNSKLPQRLQSITRQGVTMAVLDPMQFLDKGLTGVYEVDLWIKSVNPNGQRRRPTVWSPDMQQHRRTG